MNSFYIRTDSAMRPQNSHQCCTPHFVVKIFLEYKTAFHILCPQKGSSYQFNVYRIFYLINPNSVLVNPDIVA